MCQPRKRTEHRWLNRTVWGFALASLFSDLGHEMVTALTPGFLLTLGAPPIALGLIEGISGMASSLANLWGGKRADTAPNRKPYLVTGYLATTLKFLYAFASSWPWLVLIRTFSWLGRGMRGPMRDRVITDTISPNAYGRAMGFREGMDTLGALAGPLIGAGFLTFLGYRKILAASAIPGILSVLVIVFFVQDNRLHRHSEYTAEREIITNSRLPKTFWNLVWSDGLFSVGNVAPSFFILAATTQMTAYWGSATAAAFAIMLYAWHNLLYSVTAVLAGHLADRYGPKPILVYGYITWCLALLGFMWARPVMWLYVGLFTLTGLSTGMQESVQKTYVSLLLHSQVRGRGLGIHASVLGWGALVSGVLVGGLWTIRHSTWGFGVAALCTALSLLFLWRTVPQVKSQNT